MLTFWRRWLTRDSDDALGTPSAAVAEHSDADQQVTVPLPVVRGDKRSGRAGYVSAARVVAAVKEAEPDADSELWVPWLSHRAVGGAGQLCRRGVSVVGRRVAGDADRTPAAVGGVAPGRAARVDGAASAQLCARCASDDRADELCGVADRAVSAVEPVAGRGRRRQSAGGVWQRGAAADGGADRHAVGGGVGGSHSAASAGASTVGGRRRRPHRHPGARAE
eukprot:ctg_2450.g345